MTLSKQTLYLAGAVAVMAMVIAVLTTLLITRSHEPTASAVAALSPTPVSETSAPASVAPSPSLGASPTSTTPGGTQTPGDLETPVPGDTPAPPARPQQPETPAPTSIPAATATATPATNPYANAEAAYRLEYRKRWDAVLSAVTDIQQQVETYRLLCLIANGNKPVSECKLPLPDWNNRALLDAAISLQRLASPSPRYAPAVAVVASAMDLFMQAANSNPQSSTFTMTVQSGTRLMASADALFPTD